jgi:hypothetical protein
MDDGGMIKLDGQETAKSDYFQYLGSIIHKDVAHKIKAG